MYTGARQIALLLAGVLMTAGSVTPSEMTAELSVTARNNGDFEQNVFYAAQGAEYELEIQSSSESVLGALTVQIGEREIPVQLEEGKAVFPVEPGVAGKLQVWYEGAETPIEFPDYIVAEDTAPLVKSALLEGEDGKKLQLTIEDAGDIISGIHSYEYLLNGEKPEGCQEQRIEKELADGVSVCSRIEIAIPLENQETYELKVIADDQCGNSTEKTMSKGDLQDGKGESADLPKEGLERNIEQDGIAVVLPTDISLMVFSGPNPVEGNIQSQDIMVINRNDFPVRVYIRQAQYEIEQDEEEVKQCDLGIKVREYNKEENFVEIPSSAGENLYCMELGAGLADTDAQALLEKAAEWVPTGDVQSPDYGVLRLEGTTTQGANWEKGDLKVSLVFDLERME